MVDVTQPQESLTTTYKIFRSCAYVTLTSGLSIAHRSKQCLSASLLDGSIMVGDGSTISVREKAEAGAEWEPLELHLVAEGLTLDCVRTNRAEIMTMVN